MKKQLVILVAATSLLSGCGITNLFKADSEKSIREETMQLDTVFEKEGVKVFYTLFNNIDRIEAVGSAEVWKRNYETVAEAEAKDKLVKFLRGESVSSRKKLEVIAKAMEQARDGGSTSTIAEDLDKTKTGQVRASSMSNAQMVTSTITVTSSGGLSAVRKLRGAMVNDGKTYVATYVWTVKDQDAARSITKMMDAR